MRVRSAVFPDLFLITVCGGIAWICFSAANDPSIYSRRCHGRSAALCELIKATHDPSLFGMNPVLLGMAVYLGWLAIFGFVRLGCGWTVRFHHDEVQVLRPWGIARARLDMVETVTVRERLFGSIAELVLHTLDGRKLVGANGKVADAARFKAALKRRLPEPQQPHRPRSSRTDA